MAEREAGRQLTIGFLIDRWEPERGGAERCLAALAKHLERGDHNVLVFAERATGDAPGHWVRVSTRPVLDSLARARRERRLGHELVRAARAASCDVTIGLRHLPEVDLYWPHGGVHGVSLAARDQSRGRVARQIENGRHAVFLDFERQLLQEGGARRVVAVSPLVERELTAHYPACRERVRCLPNGIDLERFTLDKRAQRGAEWRHRHGFARDEPLLAFVGADPRLKGLPAALEALAPLAHVPWRLFLTGMKRPERWRRIAARLGLDPERLSFAERVSTPELFAAADLVLLPTWRDTSSLVVLEALASGTPVVTTSAAGEADRIVEGQGGTVLTEPGDSDALRGALASWLARIRAGEPIPREALRARVAERDQASWLTALEQQVLELAD